MLIDDREILSLSVQKVDGLARVGISNEYSDLSGIPTEFNPKEHTHDLASATKDGFMSADEFKKLLAFQSFKTIQLKNSNGVINIDATKIDDKFIIKAGKNVAFEIDQVSKTLTIANTFELDESQLVQGDKGQKGDKGDDGLTWRPTVSASGVITWELDSVRNATPPTEVNIKGKAGKDGTDGKTYKPSYNETTKKIEYVESNDNTVPAELDLRGRDGEKGTRGITWRPVIDADKNLTYVIDNNGSTEAPKRTNIAGEVVEGQPGKDAELTTWEKLSGLPFGGPGEVLKYIGNGYDRSTPMLDSGPIFDTFYKRPLTIETFRQTLSGRIQYSHNLWRCIGNKFSNIGHIEPIWQFSSWQKNSVFVDILINMHSNVSLINTTPYQKLRSLYYLLDTQDSQNVVGWKNELITKTGVVFGAPISYVYTPSKTPSMTKLEVMIVEVLDSANCSYMAQLFPLYPQLVNLSEFEYNCTYICLTYNAFSEDAKLLNAFKLKNGYDISGNSLEPENPEPSEIKDVFFPHRKRNSGNWKTEVYFKYSIPERNNNIYELDVFGIYKIKFKFNETTLLMESFEESNVNSEGGLGGVNIYTYDNAINYLKEFHKYNKVSGVTYTNTEFSTAVYQNVLITYSKLNTKEDFLDALPKNYPDPYMFKSYTTPTDGPLTESEKIQPIYNFLEPDNTTITPLPFLENNDASGASLARMFGDTMLIDMSGKQADSTYNIYRCSGSNLVPMAYTPNYSKNLTYINNYDNGTDVVQETKYTILI